MADEDARQVADEPSADSPAGDSDEGAALTPEERDNQTIARLMGTADEDDEESADDADAEVQPDAEEGEEDEEDESETPSAEADTTDTDAEEDEEGDYELTEDDIEAFLDAVGEDRLLERQRIRERLQRETQAEVDRRIAEREQQMRLSSESESLIRRGREAAEKIYNLTGKAGEALAKALEGEEFDGVTIDPQEVKKAMSEFAIANTLMTRKSYDEAFTQTFRELAPLTGEQFEPEEGETIKGIVQTAERIRRDPEQGDGKATAYLFRESFKFLVDRAKQAGKREAQEEARKRREATRKLVGDENALNAARAKVSKQRKKAAPASTREAPGPSVAPATIDAYRAAKLKGDKAEADRILQEMQRQGAGQPVPGR